MWHWCDPCAVSKYVLVYFGVVDCYFRKTKDSAISITVHGARRGHHCGTSCQGPRSPPEDRTPVNEIHKCSIPKWTNSCPRAIPLTTHLCPTKTQGARAAVQVWRSQTTPVLRLPPELLRMRTVKDIKVNAFVFFIPFPHLKLHVSGGNI